MLAIVLSNGLTTDLTTGRIQGHTSRQSRLHSPAVGTSRSHLRRVHLQLGIHVTRDQRIGDESGSTSSHSRHRVVHVGLGNTSVHRRELKVQNSSLIHLQELHHEQVTTHSEMSRHIIGNSRRTATVTVNNRGIKRINVQEGSIIRIHLEVVVSVHKHVEVSVHVRSVVITETLIQTRPSVTRSLVVGIGKVQLRFNLAVLSRVLVVVIEGRRSALSGTSPVASNETRGGHFSLSANQELDGGSNRSHAVLSSDSEHLIRHRRIRELSSDRTRGRVHGHRSGKSRLDRELVQIGIRANWNGLNRHTHVLGHRIKTIAQRRRGSNDTNTELSNELLVTDGVGATLLRYRGSSRNDHGVKRISTLANLGRLKAETNRQLRVYTRNTILGSNKASTGHGSNRLTHSTNNIQASTIPIMQILRNTIYYRLKQYKTNTQSDKKQKQRYESHI